MYVIKLPRMSTFTSRKNEISPYINFYKWLVFEIMPESKFTSELYEINELGLPQGISLDILKVGLCKEDDEKLTRKVYNWTKNYSELKYMKNILKKEAIDKKITEAVSYLRLDIGPKVYDQKERAPHIVPGYVYVEEDFLKEVNNG